MSSSPTIKGDNVEFFVAVATKGRGKGNIIAPRGAGPIMGRTKNAVTKVLEDVYSAPFLKTLAPEIKKAKITVRKG